MPNSGLIDDEQLSRNLRRNLARLMEEQGLNATALSRAAGLNLRAVRDILDGRAQSPKLSTSYKLAYTLGVPLASLLVPALEEDDSWEAPHGLLFHEIGEFLDSLSPAHQERLLVTIRLLASLYAER